MAILKTEGRRQNTEHRLFLSVFYCLLSVFCVLSSARAERIKDIASFEGVRDNQLIGYGIVVGLDGSGDKGQATVQSIVNMLLKMGITINPKDINAKNTAAVMVTATFPPFAKPGTKVDALVSTIGDAKSIQGGTLLLAPLKGPDGKAYALAQGPVSIGGFSAGAEGTVTQKNHLTAGRVPEGVTIEKEVPFTLGSGTETRLFLHHADFTTANKVAQEINQALNGDYAFAVDPSSIKVIVPLQYNDNPVGLMTKVEMLDVQVDMPARIVINERTGTVIIGDNVKISPVAVAHGALTIEIKKQQKVSQPLPFAPEKAETVVVPEAEVTAKEEKAFLVQISGVTLGEIVRALNALGVTPRDLIAILQALKASGALRAELEII